MGRKFLGWMVLAGVFLASPSVWAASGEKKHAIDPKLAGLFTKYDKNHDKFLDKTEVTQVATAAFNSRDLGKDGFLDKPERKKWLTKAMLKEYLGKDDRLSRKDYLTVVTYRFDAADRGGAGKVTLEEFAGWRMGKTLAKLLNPPPLNAASAKNVAPANNAAPAKNVAPANNAAPANPKNNAP
ncbi:MAG: hypothetical protein QM537_07265 [Candidatus Symbiobacter sp.]|nr:hypothetical protein [Candidatus Symbiobacter sp.]